MGATQVHLGVLEYGLLLSRLKLNVGRLHSGWNTQEREEILFAGKG